MNNSYEQSLDWLKAQARRFTNTFAINKAYSLKLSPREAKLLELINVQTGLIEKLHEDTLELETLLIAHRTEFEKFTHRLGLNYPQ
jgi:hypothetical protein